MPPKKVTKPKSKTEDSVEMDTKESTSTTVEQPPKSKGRNAKPKKTPAPAEVEDSPGKIEKESKPSPPKRPRRAAATKTYENGVKEAEKEKPVPAKRGRKAKEPAQKEVAIESEEKETLPPKKKGRAKKTAEPEPENDESDVSASSLYDFKANDITGKEIALSKYEGHICIIVNVASKCGHTKSNYEQFVELYDKYSESKGLRILAFPCNQFGRQEPGDSAKISEFVSKRNVKFDMFEKIEVNGKNAHGLWKWLKEQKEGPKGKDITWNFTKFIVDKDGKVVDRFQPSVKPLQLLDVLEKLW